jgi:hypothetical protein
MKPTIKNLAEYIGKSRQAVYHMKRNRPKEFEIMWLGWETHCRLHG